jgi:hypothetical protein
LEQQRYPNWGPSLWSFDGLPANTAAENLTIFAQDGGESHGTLYSRGGEKTVFCLMHPREDLTRDYTIPYLLEAGFAVFGQVGRWGNNDLRLIHELLLCDVAESVRTLKARGYENIVLLGCRGGGPLYALYQSQACLAPDQRLKKTAAGDPYDLGTFDMPEADGFVQLAAHLGEGVFMGSSIDPSVTNEADPLSCDPALDMFNPDNGFEAPPKSSRYAPEFLDLYRRAQRGRIARIDVIARDHLQHQRHFREEMADPEFERTSAKQQNFIMRRALVSRVLTIHRTEANPEYCDLSLQQSKREYGSFLSPRPDVFNYSETGFGKYQTPRAWLSTWSSLSSRANTLDCIKSVTIPSLVVGYDGDQAVGLDDLEAAHENSAAADKTLCVASGDHLGLLPRGASSAEGGRDAAMAAITGWARERW